jgi:hypothetical protein
MVCKIFWFYHLNSVKSASYNLNLYLSNRMYNMYINLQDINLSNLLLIAAHLSVYTSNF